MLILKNSLELSQLYELNKNDKSKWIETWKRNYHSVNARIVIKFTRCFWKSWFWSWTWSRWWTLWWTQKTTLWSETTILHLEVGLLSSSLNWKVRPDLIQYGKWSAGNFQKWRRMGTLWTVMHNAHGNRNVKAFTLSLSTLVTGINITSIETHSFVFQH